MAVDSKKVLDYGSYQTTKCRIKVVRLYSLQSFLNIETFMIFFSFSFFTVLAGVEVQPEHCVIENEDGIVTLYPINNALCTINAVNIQGSAKLTQGELFNSSTLEISSTLKATQQNSKLWSFSLLQTNLTIMCYSFVNCNSLCKQRKFSLYIFFGYCNKWIMA